MTPLEAARKLAEGPPTYVNDYGITWCAYCGGNLDWVADHKDDCPWLAMPQIVVALEAAVLLMNENPNESDYSSNPGGCAFCEGKTSGGLFTLILNHEAECPWQSLNTALQRVKVR